MTRSGEQFDAKSARTRQPMPLWSGAFDRATKEQGPEIIGAYMLILMAMWEAKSCDLPADEKHLAWVAKVSTTIWRRKYAPIIMPMLSEENSRIFSKKLQENAEKTEEYCRKQHERKSGKNHAKPLNVNDAASTADVSADHSAVTPPDEPLPLTINSKKKEEEGASAREVDFSSLKDDKSDVAVPSVAPGLIYDLRQAVGVQPHEAGAYWSEATVAAHVEAWRSFGLTDEQIIAEAKASREKNPEPPAGPKALDRWMQAAGSARRNLPAHGKPQERAVSKPPPSPEERLKFYADWINGEKACPPSAVSTSLAQALLHYGLVTRERLKERQIAA